MNRIDIERIMLHSVKKQIKDTYKTYSKCESVFGLRNKYISDLFKRGIHSELDRQFCLFFIMRMSQDELLFKSVDNSNKVNSYIHDFMVSLLTVNNRLFYDVYSLTEELRFIAMDIENQTKSSKEINIFGINLNRRRKKNKTAYNHLKLIIKRQDYFERFVEKPNKMFDITDSMFCLSRVNLNHNHREKLEFVYVKSDGLCDTSYAPHCTEFDKSYKFGMFNYNTLSKIEEVLNSIKQTERVKKAILKTKKLKGLL